jgi:hypothetical protein
MSDKKKEQNKITKDGIKKCIACGKVKTDLKWIKTRYCSLNCWYNYNLVNKKRIYF